MIEVSSSVGDATYTRTDAVDFLGPQDVSDPIANQLALQPRAEQLAVRRVESFEVQFEAAHPPTPDLHRGEVAVGEGGESQLVGRGLAAVDLDPFG